ncbi:MAG: chromosomal replication initiator protein DnaA [Phycisphaera sp.]|nr:chromosomal replication initiator protein DnaA [Phycisphaera sp.]
MAKVDATLWRDMLAYLRKKHAPICRAWFEDLRPTGLDSGLLKVHASNTVQQNYLQRRCLDQFTEAAQATTGKLLAVQFVNKQDAGSVLAGTLHEPDHTPGSPGSPGSQTLSGGHGHGNGHDQSAPSIGSSLDKPATPKPRTEVQTIRTVTAGPASNGQSDETMLAYEDEIVISPDCSFDQFVTGPTNRLAYAAAVAVANQPGTAYNPLFIHGGVGLGKTHLLQAICQTLLQTNPSMRICYLSCDAFMNQFLDCVQNGKMSQFKHHYRHVDVLVIDDIHFLANRERTQEEFFHTFNELYQHNKQIVLSSDSPPSEIPQLEERLVSRFGWGLVAPITKPDFETRLAIVRAKSKLRDVAIPDDVAHYIANKVDSNARELEGALNNIQGHALLTERQIDLALAQQALGDPVIQARNAQVTLQQIIDVVTAHYNVRLADLQSKRRHKSITEPRQVCMWLARKRTRFSLEEIGGYFGGRDHTTVMHSIRSVEDRNTQDEHFRQQVEMMTQRIDNVR